MDILWSSEETDDAWPVIILMDGTTLGNDGSWREVNVPTLTELARRLLAERAEQERLDDHNDKMEARALRLLQVQETELAGLDREVTLLKQRVAELDKNLAHEVEQRALETRELRGSCATSRPGPAAALEAPPADKLSSDAIVLAPIGAMALSWTKENRMVDPDGRVALDLGDYDNLRPEEHAWLSRLADLWSAWGDKGYLRERLKEAATSSGPMFPDDAWRDHPDFRQLRSELLAVPWLFEKKEEV